MVEEQFVADSRTWNAILKNAKGKTIPSNSTTGNILRLDIRRTGGGEADAGYPLAAAELDIVTLFIPEVEM